MLPYTFHCLFQWMMEAQNRRIDELVDRIRQQQEKLDKQNIRIRTLQNQVAYDTDTVRLPKFLSHRLSCVPTCCFLRVLKLYFSSDTD